MRLVAALLTFVLAGCAIAGPVQQPALDSQTTPARFVEVERMPASGLPDQRLTIWLPPGYDDSPRRYPVLYMHDGHNLFDPEKSNFNKVWAADKAMVAAMDSGKVSPHIIVGIWAPGGDRYRQYLPQSLYEMAEGEPRAAMDAMIEGPPIASAYLDWLAGPLKQWVDANYRTMPGRDATAIMGSSMGGADVLLCISRKAGNLRSGRLHLLSLARCRSRGGWRGQSGPDCIVGPMVRGTA